MYSPQDLVHKLEEGGGIRYVRIAMVCLALVLLVICYDWRCYRNMDSQEAMDAAQVARNVSEGEGFTTQFIRPFSVYLVKKHNETSKGAEEDDDPARIKRAHPDLANAPLYPLVLAGWMKVYPALLNAAESIRGVLPGFLQDKLPHFNTDLDNWLWSKNHLFWWHPDDCLIALFNQALFFVVIILTFKLAKRLFDSRVAWLSALLLLGCEYLWHFSSSGLPTMLLLLIFTGLVWCLVLFEAETREPKGGPKRLLLLAAFAVILTGLGALTRYSFGWMIIPVLCYMGWLAGPRRFTVCLLGLAVFVAVLSPWVARNYRVSGTPFGTAGYAVIEDTPAFPEHKLERSLEPDFNVYFIKTAFRKLIVNTRQILLNDLPRLGGGWVMPFFLVGLMLGMRNPGVRHLRYLVMVSLLAMILVQALGSTHVSTDTPEFNSENLMVLFLPLFVVYGVSLFFVFLDQIDLPTPNMGYAVMGAFATMVWLPLIYQFLPPTKSVPVTYPPYFPPLIQQSAGWMRENELMMSDIPWAVAWYGDRQCIWLSLDAKDEFYAINDYLKDVRALYLSPKTMDSQFVTDWVRPGPKGWGAFLIDAILDKKIPSKFPLRKAPAGYFPKQLFLTDWDRWNAGDAGSVSNKFSMPPTESATPEETLPRAEVAPTIDPTR